MEIPPPALFLIIWSIPVDKGSMIVDNAPIDNAIRETQMQTIQQQMKAKLETVGVPFKAIECYGSQIVVTSQCRDTADKWAALLGKFAKVRGVIKSLDECKANRGTVLVPSTVEVFRTFAVVA